MHFPVLFLLFMSLLSAAPPAPGAGFAEFDARARAGEPLSVVFWGGSLTWGANASDPNRTSYRGLMADYLRQKYPKSSFTFHDAAIGGTGSDLGLFRLERDVLDRDPDLVFLDFTVNDGLYAANPRRAASYETLLREMISRGILVEIVAMGNREVANPAYDITKLGIYQNHLKLADAYQTALGDTILRLQSTARKDPGILDVLYPFDNIHPDDPGYRVFFEAARDGFEAAIKEKRVNRVPESPLSPDLYVHRKRILLRDLPLPKGWKLSKTYRTSLWFDGLSSRWMGDVVLCDINDKNIVEPLKISFEGTLVALFGEANEEGLGFRVLIDGQPVPFVQKKKDPEPVWPFDTTRFGKGNLFKFQNLSENLAPGKHSLEIHPVFPENVTKGQLRIESICVAGPESSP